jgi:hypothetical protein
MTKVFHSEYQDFENEINNFIESFETSGTSIKDKRNKLKLFELNGKTINIKSFKVPNVFNQIAYKFIRKSKARRSFEYANKLIELGINTPQPVAYYEFPSTLFFKRSYYVSEHLNCDLTYRELSKDLNLPGHEKILRAFTRFTFNLHEKNILFLDHSPGNTLINISDEGYTFNLVDLNRMQFKPLSFITRIRNFRRLTKHKSMVEVMSDEYARCSDASFEKVFELMWHSTEKFQRKFNAKKELKNKLKFWKK